MSDTINLKELHDAVGVLAAVIDPSGKKVVWLASAELSSYKKGVVLTGHINMGYGGGKYAVEHGKSIEEVCDKIKEKFREFFPLDYEKVENVEIDAAHQ